MSAPSARPQPDGPPLTSFAADRTRRSAETDRWLASLLGAEPGVALVAVGGYGRRELLPGSDLDVLLLHGGRDGIAAMADRIWYPIWDSGTRLDHAVRTTAEARRVARADLKVALGLLYARHVAGDPDLTNALRLGALEDWRASAGTRLAELQALHVERAQRSGELAFLLEPDLKEARGGLRDVHAIQAIAAAWVAPGPGPRVRAAYESIMDARHALHEITGRPTDRLVLQEQDEVARVLGLLDADALMRHLAGAGRAVAYSVDQAFRQAQRSRGGRRRSKAKRRPVADGLVEQDGEVVLARAADPATDPALPLRAAAAAAQSALALAPRTLTRLAECPPLPVPWPPEARDALVALLGAGPAAVPVWEALDQEGLVASLLPDWDRVRNRPQRNPLHTYTVDRHLVEAAVRAAALTRDVARPDLLLLSALLHDIGKGWPGDHRVTGEVVARDVARRVGLGPSDAELVAGAVRHHLLLPQTATRRDLDDPVTVAQVASVVGGRPLLELLHALAIADGLATGPAAWNDWKESLVGDLVRRVESRLAGEQPAEPLPLRPDQAALADEGAPAARVRGSEVTVVAPDRPGLLWQAAGVLASHRLAVRSANATSHGTMAVAAFTVAPEYGDPPDADLVTSDLRRALEGRLDVAERLERRIRAYRESPMPVPVAPPKVTLLDDASRTATVVEVRAHDAPGLLWRIGRALGDCGLDVRAARVETLGAEAVDVFYVVDTSGGPVGGSRIRGKIAAQVLAALTA
ncbi:MAG TPA: [protein-PII] uridylyltransferase [Streptosporangiaceae bacterium]|nr:[protein-PII] uridylyltransferase [Streptosporangiaceae bacterium]